MLPIRLLFMLLSAYSPFAVDSTIFSVDVNSMVIREQNLRSMIIDYCLDDYLYVLTKRYLFKMDPDDLRIIDRTLLPQTFFSMCTNQTKVMLISAGELVIITKSHLAYVTGIGRRFSDCHLLVSPQGRSIAPDENSLYFIETEGSLSTIKIINLHSGTVFKNLRVPMIIDYRYNMITRTFTTLDIENHLITYTLDLKRITAIKVPPTIDWFIPQAQGLFAGSHTGIYLLTDQGALVDFQPLIDLSGQSYDDLTFIVDQNLVHIDSLTLRTQAIVPNTYEINHLFSVDHPFTVIGMDGNHNFYFIRTHTMDIHPHPKYESIPMDIQSQIIPQDRDSLWYLQLGAFSNPENALHLFQALRACTIPVFVDTAEVYRIKLGGFLDKQLGVYLADKVNINGWFSLQKKIEISEEIEFSVKNEKYILKDGYITRSEK